MKNFTLSLIALFALGLSAFNVAEAQVVNRTPIFEIFSSSTCPPCKPASDYYTPILEENHDNIVVMKYPVSWPGTGDPYYTAEGGSRRSYYGVNAAPQTFANGSEFGYTGLNTSQIDLWNTDVSPIDFKLKYYIDEANQTVHISGVAKILEDIPSALRIYVSINEHVTYENVKTNGETEFHNILKKMVPDHNGTPFYDGLLAGDRVAIDQTYTFNGNYRLSNNANDPIQHTIEHSVEEFSDLHVVAWAQAIITKEHFQAVNGEKVVGTGANGVVTGEEELAEILEIKFDPPTSIEEINLASDFTVYPNPTNGETSVAFNLKNNGNVTVEVTNLLGSTVQMNNHGQMASGQHSLNVDAATLPAGAYFVTLKVDGNFAATKMVNVAK